MKRVLITGVAGFLGRYAARHFLSLGWEVIGLDSLPPENAPLASLSRYVQIALPDPRLEDLLQKQPPEVCAHFAGRASVAHSVSDPAPDYYAGPVLTFEMLDSLRRLAPGCRFIFVSSAAVYGNPGRLPIREDQPADPLSPYGYHKLQGELLCQEFCRVYGLNTAILRPFSAYGPGLRRQVVWDICQKVLAKGRLFLQGTGNETRDFVHAADIAQALAVISQSAPMQGEAYNVANGRETSIGDLARLILGFVEIDSRVEFDGKVPQGVPLRWQADISRLNALGWQPQVPFEEGLRSFVDWCRAELK